MAPEIFKEEKVEDLKKCDIFSLGALFYMLLTH
jgi:serine/threonine protein kinase